MYNLTLGTKPRIGGQKKSQGPPMLNGRGKTSDSGEGEKISQSILTSEGTLNLKYASRSTESEFRVNSKRTRL